MTITAFPGTHLPKVAEDKTLMLRKG